jgi:hypothetical protein
MLTLIIPSTPWTPGVVICIKYAGWGKVFRQAFWPD